MSLLSPSTRDRETGLAGMIAEIIDARTVAITLGTDAAVAVGMRFQVGPFECRSVVHPVTRAEIGSICYCKAEIEATQVYERFSVCLVCRTGDDTWISRSGTWPPLTPTSNIARGDDVRQKPADVIVRCRR